MFFLLYKYIHLHTKNLITAMERITNKVRSLCTPAFIFFIISVISLFVMIFENIENINSYCIGNVSCNVPNTSMIFIVEIVFLVFWTWLLNFLCSRGYPGLSWFILLLPYIFLLLLVLLSASDIRNIKIETTRKDSKTVTVIDPNNDAFSGLTMRF
jgi:hypothetical protein